MLPHTSHGGASTWKLANCWFVADRPAGKSYLVITPARSSSWALASPDAWPLECVPLECVPFSGSRLARGADLTAAEADPAADAGGSPGRDPGSLVRADGSAGFAVRSLVPAGAAPGAGPAIPWLASR